VILINKFSVDPSDVDLFLNAWAADAAWMKRQPGFISTQLHRGIGGSCVFVNYAVWESVEHFNRAFLHPDFREAIKAYPPSAVASPHLFQTMAVPGICVG
jgi:heme-degrading monooxygenase HmoA